MNNSAIFATLKFGMDMRKVFLLVLGILVAAQTIAQDEGRPDLPGDLVVNFGFNSLSSAGDLKTNLIGSNSWGIYYTKRIGAGDFLSIYPGVGFGLEKFGFEEDVTLGFDSEGNVMFDSISSLGSIKKTKLAVNYLEVPLEFRIYPFRSKDGSGFFIGLGGSLGVRFESHTKVKYEDTAEDNFLTKERNDFNLNPIRAGVIGRIGSKGINAFYRMYFTELFDPGLGPNDIKATPFTVGIAINGF